MQLPPGPRYLLTHLDALLLPPLATFVVLWVAAPALVWKAFGLVAVFLAILSIPIYIWSRLVLNEWRNFWKARSYGAILPPMISYRWPGGVDLVVDMGKEAKTLYVGERSERFSKRHGWTHSVKIMFTTGVVTSEPEYIKSILATDFVNFEKGRQAYEMFESVLGNGVFSTDGEMWKFHRSMTRPFFTKDRITHFDIFDRHAEDTISQMKSRFKEGYPLDFQEIVGRFTLDSATEFLFGTDVCSLSASLPYPTVNGPYTGLSTAPSDAGRNFATEFAEAQMSIPTRARLGTAWPLFEFWKDTPAQHMKAINDLIDPIVRAAVDKRKQRGTKQTDKVTDEEETETLLEHLVKSTDDLKLIKDETLNILLAGRDTTAATITFVVYMLSQHPNVLARLREEVVAKLGSGTSGRRPTHDDLREMKYLRAVINETLRLYPAVPFNIRVAVKDTIWPATKPGQKPFLIPAGTGVEYSVFLMHRRTDLWGPDALEFDPDRFLDERLHKYLTPNPFIFLPFNAGPRICLGQQFAYNEVSFFVTRLLQSFSSISLTPDAQPEALPPARWAQLPGRAPREKIFLRSHLTMHSLGGVWLTMENADEDGTI